MLWAGVGKWKMFERYFVKESLKLQNIISFYEEISTCEATKNKIWKIKWENRQQPHSKNPRKSTESLKITNYVLNGALGDTVYSEKKMKTIGLKMHLLASLGDGQRPRNTKIFKTGGGRFVAQSIKKKKMKVAIVMILSCSEVCCASILFLDHMREKIIYRVIGLERSW